MNLEQILQQLQAVINAGDQTFSNAAIYLQQLISQIQSSDLQKEESLELLNDANTQLSILQDMSGLSLKETLITVISDLAILIQTIH